MIRGITRTGTRNLGNFWVDLTRTIVRILLPLALVFTVVLLSQGVVAEPARQHRGDDRRPVDRCHHPGDPGWAVRLAGGDQAAGHATVVGPYNTNSAHPFENPTGFTDMMELFTILLIPFAFVVTFGKMVGDKRQSRVLLAVMAGILVLFAGFTMFAETNGNPKLTALSVDQSTSTYQSGGNMEGKEVRIGAAACGIWAGATTGTSNGSVNCMHDSFTPLGGTAPMAHMMLGEISPGGVGVGLDGRAALSPCWRCSSPA